MNMSATSNFCSLLSRINNLMILFLVLPTLAVKKATLQSLIRRLMTTTNLSLLVSLLSTTAFGWSYEVCSSVNVSSMTIFETLESPGNNCPILSKILGEKSNTGSLAMETIVGIFNFNDDSDRFEGVFAAPLLFDLLNFSVLCSCGSTDEAETVETSAAVRCGFLFEVINCAVGNRGTTETVFEAETVCGATLAVAELRKGGTESEFCTEGSSGNKVI